MVYVRIKTLKKTIQYLFNMLLFDGNSDVTRKKLFTDLIMN